MSSNHSNDSISNLGIKCCFSVFDKIAGGVSHQRQPYGWSEEYGKNNSHPRSAESDKKGAASNAKDNTSASS
jgi:hypothetical protein